MAPPNIDAPRWQSQPQQQHQSDIAPDSGGGEASSAAVASGDANLAGESADDVLDRLFDGTGDVDDTTGDVATPAAPTPAPAADTPPAGDAAATAAAVAGDPAADSWLAQQTPEVQKAIRDLRDENASWRTKTRDYEGAFDGFGDDGRDFFLNLARTVREDPAQAATMARELAELLGEQTPSAGGAADLDSLDDDTPLTAGQVKAMLDQRDQTAAQQRAAEDREREVEAGIAKINEEAKALGYEADSLDHFQLLFIANKQTGGDLAEADKVLKANRQRIIDEHVSGKAREADGTATTAPQAGGAPTSEKPIRSLKDADDAMDDFLEAQFRR